MSKIYKITNDINDKVYVGKTNLSIEERFKEHCRDRLKRNNENRPLYNAMNKYGIEHFTIAEIEDCNPDEASKQEIYWIGYFHSYENGYNATMGGDGKNLYDHSAIAERLKEHPYPIDVAQEFGCSSDIVRIIAKEFNITIKNKGQELSTNINPKCKIKQYTKDLSYINEFESIADAVRQLHREGKCATPNGGARGHISDCAKGKRKTAYGYVWKYE